MDSTWRSTCRVKSNMQNAFLFARFLKHLPPRLSFMCRHVLPRWPHLRGHLPHSNSIQAFSPRRRKEWQELINFQKLSNCWSVKLLDWAQVKNIFLTLMRWVISYPDLPRPSSVRQGEIWVWGHGITSALLLLLLLCTNVHTPVVLLCIHTWMHSNVRDNSREFLAELQSFWSKANG